MKKYIWYVLIGCSFTLSAWGMAFDENAEEPTDILSQAEKDSALFSAAETNDLLTVRDMLGQGADIHRAGQTFGPTKVTPLAIAAQRGFVDILEVLLAQPGVKQEEKDLALVFAAKRSLPAVQLLLKAGANKDASFEDFTGSKKAETPLSRAVGEKSWPIVKELIQWRVTIPAEYKQIPEIQKMLSMLWQEAESPKVENPTPQQAAPVLQKPPMPRKKSLTAFERVEADKKEKQIREDLFKAIHGGDLNEVRAIIAHNQDAYSDLVDIGSYPEEFLFAAKKGYADIVQALKEADNTVGEEFMPGTQKLKARNLPQEAPEGSLEAQAKAKKYRDAQAVLEEALKIAVTEGQKNVVAYLLTQSDITPKFLMDKGQELLLLAMDKKNALNKKNYEKIFSLLVRAGVSMAPETLKKIQASQELRTWYQGVFKGNVQQLKKLYGN